jgi:hypothetical protein
MVAAADVHDCLAALLMLAARRNGVDETRQSAVIPWISQYGIFRFESEEIAAQPNAGW